MILSKKVQERLKQVKKENAKKDKEYQKFRECVDNGVCPKCAGELDYDHHKVVSFSKHKCKSCNFNISNFDLWRGNINN